MKNELLAAMYADDDSDEVATTTNTNGYRQSSHHSSHKIGDQIVTIVDVEYIENLQKLIYQQQKTIDLMQKKMGKMERQNKIIKETVLQISRKIK